MNPLVALITFSFTLHVSYSWTPMASGSMSGVTYASGTIYNVGTMCPRNVNQGYTCDGRNFGNQYLDANKVSSYCSGHTGTTKQFGFGHGVTATQKCGQCAQIRVPRTDGTYNYMTVMMVDHYTWSMEVGTTEIAYLVEGTKWVVGDRADFDFRIVGDYDCYASFGDSGNGGNPTPTPPPTTTTTTTTSSGGGNNGGNSGNCQVSNNWGNMKINPYWGSSRSSMYAMIYNPPTTISSFEIRGANQNNNQFQRCVKQNVNAFQCDISGGALTEPASVRLNGGTYYGYDIIESMTGSSTRYPLTSCGTNTGTTPTTKATTKAPTSKPISSGGGGNRCLITNRAGSSRWWYSVAVTGCGVDIDRVYLKGNGRLTWTEGIYKPWSGGYYVFTANTPYNGPISFKIRAKTGQEITSNNILADTTPNRSGRMDRSFSSAFTVENEDEDNGMHWTAIFAIIICCLVCIGCIAGGIYWWRAKGKRGKAYFVDTQHNTDETNKNGEHDTAEMIVEAEVDDTVEMIEVDAQIEDELDD